MKTSPSKLSVVCVALLCSHAACLSSGGKAGGKSSARKWKSKGVAGQASYEGKDKAISPNNLLANATFNDGTSLPWTVSFTAPGDGNAEIVDNALCINVKNKGASNWDAQLRHREMTIQRGRSYEITFKAYASAQTRMRAKVGQQGPPYREYWVDTLKLDTTPRTFKGRFRMTSANDPTAEFSFHVGGNLAYKVPEPFRVCIDDVQLIDPDFVRKDEAAPDAPPAVLVNQTGYLPGLAKYATIRTDARESLAWRLLDGGGREVLAGKTTVVGRDAPSGDNTHTINFSAFTGTGKDFVLQVENEKSHPFDISPDVYSKMRFDALAYYYHNRSGTEIKLPYAGKKELARPAGHVSDKAVPCAPAAKCDYTLDVSGGWYDAGDHGKYVVNGGVSVWTLLNMWERAKYVAKSTKALEDGTMNIPEKGNGKPDLLDEVRWNLEFMLKMQVPEGNEMAGMVHHKIHDKEWTALGLAPQDDPMPRFLYPVSTAATLNLAATAAQAARIWKTLDPEWAARCLDASTRAYEAALKHPALYAKPGGLGGGPYDDDHVEDEFYWAASELWITTGKAEYKAAATRSPNYLKLSAYLKDAKEAGIPSPLTWQDTGALGTLSLLTNPAPLGGAERKRAEDSLREAANTYVQLIEQRGYRVPMSYGNTNKAPWGSNSFITNNLLLLGTAYEHLHDRKYLDAVAQGMDYILGRNPMDQSYVTGYGKRPLVNPHHRFWSYQVDKRFPKAPPGAVSGGPNSGLEDPYVQAAGLAGCAAEKCFVDHIEAWSANEITINWNAPFAWVTAFLDDHGHTPPPSKAAPAAPTPKGKAKALRPAKR